MSLQCDNLSGELQDQWSSSITSSDQSRYTLWSCQNVCDALSYLLDNIYIRFGTKLYRQIVGIPMGTNCAPLVADLLAHLSRRLIGELLVYPCSVVCPSVRRPSVRRPQFQRSSSLKPLVLILHIHHLQVGGKNSCVFCFDRIRTLVTMVTYASHRLIMEKSENCQFLLSCWRYLNFVFAEMFIE